MNVSRTSLVALFLSSLILLSACDTIILTPPADTLDPGMVSTLAAQTLMADEQILALMNSTTPPAQTNTPVPSITPQPTSTTIPSRTPLPSFTPTITNATPIITIGKDSTLPPPTIMPDGQEIPCNAAKFLRDVTVPDGLKVRPGEHFTKVWEVQNVGYCTWTPEYRLVLVWGNKMGTEPPLSLRRTVLPGETTEISINMAAPYIPLCWQGNWMIEDPAGNRFGPGIYYTSALYVVIAVTIPGIRYRNPCD